MSSSRRRSTSRPAPAGGGTRPPIPGQGRGRNEKVRGEGQDRFWRGACPAPEGSPDTLAAAWGSRNGNEARCLSWCLGPWLTHGRPWKGDVARPPGGGGIFPRGGVADHRRKCHSRPRSGYPPSRRVALGHSIDAGPGVARDFLVSGPRREKPPMRPVPPSRGTRDRFSPFLGVWSSPGLRAFPAGILIDGWPVPSGGAGCLDPVVHADGPPPVGGSFRPERYAGHCLPWRDATGPRPGPSSCRAPSGDRRCPDRSTTAGIPSATGVGKAVKSRALGREAFPTPHPTPGGRVVRLRRPGT